ncbi:FIT family protein scs3 [Talaromyces islandicus]|uniref:Acyl-coenzyme A diphosphatase SCS3 n=1 Tax=Talaromyces islandicus TaxID=28573 RepID=A0A0U1LT87_TALIS|nr:FIT family protein scs3 [Talaromyces islandicus]
MATSSRSVSPAQSRATRRAPPAIALIIYPITLIVGSIYSVISPTARPSRKGPDTGINVSSSDGSGNSSPANYFARKNNIFNLYFVKVGWVWITFAFLGLLLTQPYFTKASSSGLRGKRSAQAFLRYSVVTLAWFLTTQWFFGPAIIDRAFVLTGGKCEVLTPATTAAAGGVAADSWEEIKLILTGAACKAAGGAWRGGHDVSGHVFMLVLGSAFLGFETLGASRYLNIAEPEAKAKDDSDDESTAADDEDSDDSLPVFARRFAWAVIGLSWWMLFMTAIWFHTWLEKLSGLAISLGVAYVTYLLPQSLLPWRDIIGIPGL